MRLALCLLSLAIPLFAGEPPGPPLELPLNLPNSPDHSEAIRKALEETRTNRHFRLENFDLLLRDHPAEPPRCPCEWFRPTLEITGHFELPTWKDPEQELETLRKKYATAPAGVERARTATLFNWAMLVTRQQVLKEEIARSKELKHPDGSPPAKILALKEQRLTRIEKAMDDLRRIVDKKQFTEIAYPSISALIVALESPAYNDAPASPLIVNRKDTRQQKDIDAELKELHDKAAAEAKSVISDDVLSAADTLERALEKVSTVARQGGDAVTLTDTLKELRNPKLANALAKLKDHGGAELREVFKEAYKKRFNRDPGPRVPPAACLASTWQRAHDFLLAMRIAAEGKALHGDQPRHGGFDGDKGELPGDLGKLFTLSESIRQEPVYDRTVSLQKSETTCMANALINHVISQAGAPDRYDVDAIYRALGGEGKKGTPHLEEALELLKKAGLPAGGKTYPVEVQSYQVTGQPGERAQLKLAMAHILRSGTLMAVTDSTFRIDTEDWAHYGGDTRLNHALVIRSYTTIPDPETNLPTDAFLVEDSQQNPPPILYHVPADVFLSHLTHLGAVKLGEPK